MASGMLPESYQRAASTITPAMIYTVPYGLMLGWSVHQQKQD